MTTEAFSRNVGKLFSELKLVIDNLSLYHSQSFMHVSTFSLPDSPDIAACGKVFQAFFLRICTLCIHLLEVTKPLESG